VQVTVEPSPIAQVTEVGVATAVTDTPGTEAVAETGPQPPDSHIQVGRFTNWSPAGFAAIDGEGSRSWLRAKRAISAGVTAATYSGVWITPVAEHTPSNHIPPPERAPDPAAPDGGA
jgi:hypothetical protein